MTSITIQNKEFCRLDYPSYEEFMYAIMEWIESLNKPIVNVEYK